MRSSATAEDLPFASFAGRQDTFLGVVGTDAVLWTPLFLTAGGLVMEMGGAMSHGAVVAREYGIPAVVGVAHATDRVRSGQQVTVDGSAGVVTPDREA